MLLSDRYERETGRVLLTGIQALVRLPLDRHARDARAGRRTAAFISGYEGSPLAGYDLELGRRRKLLDAADVTFQPGLNEEAGAMAVQGSQLAQTLDGQRYDGVTGFWYGKAPGLDRASDAFRHMNLMGTAPTGGAVALVGDDPAAKSSSVPCASEAALADLYLPTLYPADSQEILDLGVHAVELSRVSGLWVAMKLVTAVADGASSVDLDPGRVVTRDPAGARKHVPSAHLLPPKLHALERDLLSTRLRLAREYSRLNGLNRVTLRTDADRIGIVAAGKTYADLRGAFGRLGLTDDDLAAAGVRLLKVAMVWPLEPETIGEFAAGLDEIVVVEEKRAFLESSIKEILYGTPGAPTVHGKRDREGREGFPAHGELDVDTILPPLARRLAALGIAPAAAWLADRAARPRVRALLPLLSRGPYFCSGCPHNSSTKSDEGTLVGAGIGCHAMVMFMDGDQTGHVTGLSQMGGEGTQWIGMAPFLERRHYVQNLGDGTFTHSGSLSVRALVAAKVDITYKLLYNSTVAMTGGQDAVGVLPVPRLVDLLLAEGVSRIIVTTEDTARYRRMRLPAGVDVRDRSRLADAQRELATVPGVTVLIHDQECAAEKRRKRKRGTRPTPAKRVVINERICEGCGDCGQKSNCLSVHPVDTEFGRKTAIHQASCNLDFSCLEGDCPAFMTVEPSDQRPRVDSSPLGADAFPSPDGTGTGAFAARLTGIGGTGVVTVAQILATAGTIAGRFVRTLDQTGMAQKGGTVVSDVRISATRDDASSKIPAGGCDLYLGFDLLASAAAANLGVASPDRTTGILSTTVVPTGGMVRDVGVTFPDQADTVGRVLAAMKPGGTVLLDARGIAEQLFGDDQFANLLMVGVAFQRGALPLPAAAIEDAVALNGVAVDRNIQAFRRGRQFVADRAALDAALAPPAAPARRPGVGADLARGAGAPAGSELARLLAVRCDELVDYQDAGYARDYAEFVRTVREREALVTGGTAITEAVARNLHKLLAYKDEYEVARLALGYSAASVDAAVGGGRFSWRLHPPVLKALGVRRKITLGPWFAPAFSALHGMRRLRGTRLDPFGYARVRRVERGLVAGYRDAVLRALALLTPANAEQVLALAGLPDQVRGYEDVKLANVARYRTALTAALDGLQAPVRPTGESVRA